MKVIFIDGECLLCHQLVKFILHYDRRKYLKFSTLQGELAHKVLEEKNYINIDTVVYLSDGRKYFKSRAVFEILRELPFPWLFLSVARFIPQVISDFFYDLIAKNRKKFFKNSFCLNPNHYPDRFI